MIITIYYLLFLTTFYLEKYKRLFIDHSSSYIRSQRSQFRIDLNYWKLIIDKKTYFFSPSLSVSFSFQRSMVLVWSGPWEIFSKLSKCFDEAFFFYFVRSALASWHSFHFTFRRCNRNLTPMLFLSSRKMCVILKRSKKKRRKREM